MKTAAWICFLSAAITLPLVVIDIALALIGQNKPVFQVILTFLSLLTLALFVFIYYWFMKMLNDKYGFDKVNGLISFFILLQVLTTVVNSVSTLFPKDNIIIGAFVITVLIVTGILLILLGVKLLKLEYSFDGLLKPFCYINIATGICLLSVLLIPLALLGSIASDIFLGMIFLHQARKESSGS